MISDEAARELLRSAWALGDGTRVARHDGGMGSQTWIVDRGRDRWVAKSVAPHLAGVSGTPALHQSRPRKQHDTLELAPERPAAAARSQTP